MIYNQNAFDIRLGWGIKGVLTLAPVSDLIIIVDVLSFSTSVDIATNNGAIIYPYRWKDESAVAFAESQGCELADFDRKNKNGFTLSPSSLQGISESTKLVLPSPNGSTLSLSTGTTNTICGSLRNAKAVAEHAMTLGSSIAVIAAGELWEDGSLRHSFEDLLGAGAIISELKGTLSPESKSALAVFLHSRNSLEQDLKSCISGKELIERGFEEDVRLAAEFNISKTIPILRENFYSHA